MSTFASIQTFVSDSLETFNLSGIYDAEEIITRIYASHDGTVDLNTFDEVHFAWFKTNCLALLTLLSQQNANKHKFNIAVEALFTNKTKEARSLWASIEQMLWQYRLRGTYEVKDILIEAYTVGIKKIEAGEMIEKPLPWLRSTCFNVIRELRRKQDKAERPKLDPTDLTPGDEVFSEIILTEDNKAVRLAWQKLSPNEQALLQGKYIKGHSWKQIAESLSELAKQSLCTNTAKQQGFRALQKLRQFYEQIREEVKLDDADS